MYFEDYMTGQGWDIPPVTITKEKIIAFAREYDPVPFHLDEEYAKKTRFGGLIAPGVMSFATVWSGFVRMNIWGDELIAGKSSQVEWLLPVYAGDVLTGRICVSRLERRGRNTGIVEFTTEIYNQDGKKTMRGVAEAVMKARGGESQK